MTERFQPNNLTRDAQNPYPENGDIFMPEPGNGDVKEVHKSDQPASSKKIDPERQRSIHEHFEKSNERRRARGEIVGADELLTQRLMVESGVAPIKGGAPGVDFTDVADLEMRVLGNRLNSQIESVGETSENLDRLYWELNRINVKPEQEADKIRMLAKISEATREAKTREDNNQRELYRQREQRGGSYFSLNNTDFDILDGENGVEEWVNFKMNILYGAVQGKDASQHPLLQEMERAFSEAVRYKQLAPEQVQKLEETFQTRERLLVMNSAFAIGNMESVVGAARGLTAHRLLNGFNLDDGKVAAMFSRLTDVIEDKRLKLPMAHMTPDMIQEAQRDLIQEQLDLAINGQGEFGEFFTSGADKDLEKAKREEGLFAPTWRQFEERDDGEFETKREITRVEIERAVRGSFDLYVSTQRIGVHMARGGTLRDLAAFRSEPYSVFTIYNLEALLWRKFDMLTGEDEELLRRIKLDMANDHFKAKEKDGYDSDKISDVEKEEVGTRLFRDLFKIPDVFSSGWRIEVIANQLNDLYIYKEAISTALKAGRLDTAPLTDNQRTMLENLRVKGMSDDKALSQILTSAQIDVLTQKLTPDEKIAAKEKADNMGLFMKMIPAQDLGKREGMSPDEYRTMLWGKIAKYRPEEIIRLFRERDPKLLDGAIDYDDFKKTFGSVTSLLRSKALAEGRQLDTWNLLPDELQIVDAAIGAGAGARLQEAYRKIRDFIQNKKVKDKYIETERSVIGALVKDDRFFDIYQRSLLIDDALLGELEDPAKNSGMVRLAEKIGGITSGGDMLVRMMNDTTQAKTAGEHLLKFMTTENLEKRMEAAIEFAANTTYNGRSQQAKAVRYTIGTVFELSKMPLILDALGISKLPMRKAMTEYEKIYGPGVDPISREQLRKHIDHIGNYLVSAADKPTEEELLEYEKLKEDGHSEKKIEKKMAHDRKERLHKAESTKRQLEHLLEITGFDEAKRRALGLLFFLLLAILVEGVQTGKATVGSSSARH